MKVKGTNDKLGKTQDCLDCLELIKRSVSAYTCLYPLSFEQGVNLLKTSCSEKRIVKMGMVGGNLYQLHLE